LELMTILSQVIDLVDISILLILESLIFLIAV
jgi:hypothetical protein